MSLEEKINLGVDEDFNKILKEINSENEISTKTNLTTENIENVKRINLKLPKKSFKEPKSEDSNEVKNISEPKKIKKISKKKNETVSEEKISLDENQEQLNIEENKLNEGKDAKEANEVENKEGSEEGKNNKNFVYEYKEK